MYSMLKYLYPTAKLLIPAFYCLFNAGICNAQDEVFKPTVESLQNYDCPEWFRDAKFGIYCHWNAQSASKSQNSGWYARNMYIPSHNAFKDHLENWGHPSEVGYKDVVEAWEADKFDAEYWVQLFNNAGAKYIITMAVHHDNFDFWDSKYQPRWNSLNYGPKKDVCGEIRKETLKAGLRWGVSTHLGRAYSWFQTNKGADKTGPYKGIPYDGNDPAYQDLYLPKAAASELGRPDDQLRHPLDPPQSWKSHWKNRIIDLIDNYHPDHLYFDGALPFMNDAGKTGMEVMAHFYNHNAQQHKGKNEGVMVIKNITRHGYFYPGISSVVLERRRSDHISREPMQTENSIGPWFHTGNSERYRSSTSLLHEMIDVVSKNCNFLLNIPPKADGSFDEATLSILKDFGSWLEINGEAIYGTRPWNTFGEGDVRFTRKDHLLFAISLARPDGSLVLRLLEKWNKKDIKSIELLGNDKELKWKTGGEGLVISMADDFDRQPAYAFKITCSRDPMELPFEQAGLQSVDRENREAAMKYGADGQGGHFLPGTEPLDEVSKDLKDQDLYKVLNWNVLLSFDHGKAVKEGVEWIKNQDADVVALQELNGQTDESFRELALGWGHEHAVLLKENGYPVGLSSRNPIEIIEKRIAGFQHGYLHVQTYGIHFFVIHLWPAHDHESIEICKVVKKYTDAGERVIVLGDFNAESPKDYEYFVTKPKLKSIVDYTVLNRFANVGLVDLTNKHDKNALVSDPSPIVIPKWHENLESIRAIERRIDFILASANVAEKSRASTIIRNADLDRISDHYPVIAVFDCSCPQN